MKKILLSLLLAGSVQYSFAMQGGGGAAAQGGAAQSGLSKLNKQLIEAANLGNVESVRTLLAGCADVNVKNENGSTALMAAAFNGHVEVVKALLANGANVDVQNAKGWAALMYAAQNRHVEIVRDLLANGANVDVQNANSATALMIAAQNGHVEVVKALLDSGANVNLQNAKGWAALMYAAEKGHVEIVRDLLANGANVDVQGEQGSTALMSAADKGHAEVVKALLANGANVDVQNANSVTALIYAAYKGHVEVVIALLDKGADVNLKDSKGKTAIDCATGKKEIMALLKKPMQKSVKGKKASKGSTDLASTGGGVTRTVGGACQTFDKTLCTEVSAKILADAVSQTDDLGSQSAGTQTESIQVGSSQATAQKRLLISSPKSAFSKPRLSGKPSSASEMDCDEARASGGIVVPIAVRPNIAPHVAAPQVFSLQPLIAMARANGTGLFGLIQLLHNSENVYFYSSEALRLMERLGFDTLVFAGVGYQPITGLDLAMLLNNSISSRLGQVNDAVGFTAEQTQQFQILATLFNQLP